MGGGGEGGSDGARKELIETVLTCEGNIKDPELPLKISRLIHHLQIITDCKSSDWLVRKVEPWNSVRVTFSIPKEAAGRLHQLAQSDASALRQLGILSVQVEGDRIVSLRVAGPNNEAAEILIRTDSLAGPSGERCRPSVPNLSPHVAGIGGGLFPAVLNQHHPQPHPVPRFRSPSNPQANDGFPASQGRLVSQLRTHEFPVGEPLPSSPQQAQHVHHGSMVSHHPSTIQRPVYPVNPPPPYPSNDLRIPAKATNPQQRINISSLPGQQQQQQFVTQSNVSLSSIQQSPLGTPVQTLTSGFRSHNGQMSTVESTNSNMSNRNQIKVQGSTVKNSPLLVGLLQQPEQNSSASAQKSKKFAVVSTTQTVGNYSTSVLENGPVSNGNIIASSSSLVPSILRSQDSSLIHQKVPPACSSAGSIIANNHLTSISTEPTSSSNAISTLSSDRLNDSRKLLPIASTSVQCNPALAPSTVVVNKDTRNVDDAKDSTSTVNKKESQYLINPNTGLLEPRPNTDSSDSEPDFRSDSPDNFHSAMNMNEDYNTSQKGLNPSDASVKQGTTSSLPDPKNAQDRAWESDTLSSSPGEKIKLRLKLGKEQMAQTTLVSPVKKLDHRKEIPTTNAADSSPVHSGGEPKVPKLHIKLHYSQPVIIKSADDQEDPLDSCSKEERIYKKKISKFKGKNSEVSLEPFKCKSVKDKLNLDNPFNEEDPSLLDAKALMDLKSKSEIDVEDKSWKYKDMPGGRNKVSRLSDFMKPKVESKLRTRLKKPGSLRKVGDLSSVGEIASHKIMETLPPSITKVAAIHTQQPHKNPSSISPLPFSPGTPSSLSASVPTTSSYNSPSVVSPPFHLVATPSSVESKPDNTIDKRASENKTEKRVDCESSTSDILMTTFRMNSSPIKGLLNGDVPHSEKVKINQMRFKRTGLMSPQAEFPCATKLTIKRKNVEETHTLKSLKKDGLTSVPTFLNSSVLINKVSSDSPNVSGVPPTSSANHGQDVSDKVLRKVDNINSSIRSEISSLKSNSDITIHSVSKNDIFGLSKLNELEKKSDLIVKAKPEPSTKVGKVTCVDVMDRKALEEALKSSRNSSKKNETAISRSTSSMVDRLRRWNSIDNSSTVPLSSHSLSQPSESTNSSVLIKEELKERGENISISEANLSVSASSTSGSVKNDPTVSKHSSKDNVHTNSCDNSDKERVDVAGSRLSCTTEREQSQIKNNCETVPPDCDQKKPVASAIEIPDLQSERRALALNEVDIVDVAMKSKCEQVKITEIGSSLSSLKSEIESPEGTPKGEHGNGHGGEDSGIESMDTLSEKSPNHSDQSPNRREEKECDLYADKCKLSKTIVPPPKVKNEAKGNFETASSVVSCNTLVKDQNCMENDLPENCPSKSKVSETTVLKSPLESSKDPSNVLKVLKNETEVDNIAIKNEDHQYASIKECTNNDGNSYHTVVSTSAEKVDVFTSNEVRESNFSHMQDSLSSVTSKVSSSSHSVNSPICHSINSVTTTSQIVTSVLSSPTTTSAIVFTSNSNIKIVNCHCSSTTITSSLSVSSPKASVVTSSCLGTSPVISNCPNKTLPSLHSIKTHDCSSVPPVPVTLSVNLKSPSVAKSIANDKLTSEAFSDTVDKISDKKSGTVVSFSSSFPSAHCNVSSYSCRSASLDSSRSSPSMIVLTTTTSVNTIMTSSNNAKVVSLKPSRSQVPKPSINPPLGKAFRLVAVHGISPMVPSTSPVKGQLVTVKPVISTCSSQAASKTSSLLQTVPSAKVENPVQHSILKARLTSEHSSAVDQTSASSKSCETISSSESHVDDLDFVGFSSPEKLAAESKEDTSKGSKEIENSDPDCLANKEDPTPLRLNPPLYTYGNKEKKKEADSDNEERDKEEMSECKVVLSETLPLSLLSPAAVTLPDQKPPDCTPVVIKTETPHSEQSSSDVHSDTKDRKLNELTIEIPNSEILPDDKRLTRSTRHSARLASPKINSPAGSEVSPMMEKRSMTSISSLSRPSPVGITRSSVSPALKGVKRGRHESESSTTSNLSEDLTESSVKAPRRKIADKVACKEEDGPKSKLFKKDVDSMDKEKEAESSEGEISVDGESTLNMKRKAVSDVPMENAEEASRPSSRSGRCSTRTRDRQLSSVNVASSDASSPVPRATTPTRRTLRQSKAARVASPSSSPSPVVSAAVPQAPTASPGVGGALEKTEVVAPEGPAAPEKKGTTPESEKTGRSAQRVLRKDATEGDADAAASGRRKTRSATNVVTNTDDCRRRRHSKEK